MKYRYLAILFLSAITAQSQEKPSSPSGTPEAIQFEPEIWEDEESGQMVVTIRCPRANSIDEVGGVTAGMLSSFIKSGSTPQKAGTISIHGLPGVFMQGEFYQAPENELICIALFGEGQVVIIQATGAPPPNEKNLEKILSIKDMPLEFAVSKIKEFGEDWNRGIPEFQEWSEQVKDAIESEQSPQSK